MNPNHSDILVIEDDKQIQIFLKYVLEKEHYACQQAETGEQALTRLEDRPADVILLDLGLPDIDGMDLITNCLLYTSPSPRDGLLSRMPSSA